MSIVIALISTAVAIFFGMAILYKYQRRIATNEQSFRFHELRDKLQLLAIDQKIDRKSPVYEFLLFTINLAIKNAGTMKLSQLLRLSDAIGKRMNANAAHQMIADIQRQDQEVQQLSADVFESLSHMLISNDQFMFFLAKAMEISTNRLKGAARNAIKGAARIIMPDHTEAVRAALNYRQLGDTLNLQLHH